MLLKVKLSEVQLFLSRAIFHTLPLVYFRTYVLRTYARKNYSTVEIYPNS